MYFVRDFIPAYDDGDVNFVRIWTIAYVKTFLHQAGWILLQTLNGNYE
jgi:hypothetical protein